MTDEPRPDDQATPATDAGTATSEAPPVEGVVTEEGNGEGASQKLPQKVETRDVGPCRKHVKVTVDRSAIDMRLKDKFGELGKNANVPGFRPGKAPMRIVQKRFKSDVTDQVKTEILLASLEQLAEEEDIAPLSAPDINPAKIELPEEGDFIYEFEVEVRPEFDLPAYKGLKLRRPVYTFTDDDVTAEQRKFLSPYGQLVPKPEGNAGVGDVLFGDVKFLHDGKELSHAKEVSFRVEKRLAFKDGVAENFGEQIKGAGIGDKRTVDVVLSSQASNAALRGITVQMELEVKDVKTVRLPDLTEEFLGEFGLHSAEQLKELMGVVLKRRLEYQQRQSAREQVMLHIAASAGWELPQDLLVRQARKAMQRRVMEMRADGISEEEIQGRVRLMQQDIMQSTEMALKEHFVLQKIAEVEKIEVKDDDIEAEIDRMAEQSGETARRVRARLEKEDMIDALAAEMIERKALDLILEHAEYEDVTLGDRPESAVTTSEEQAVPGQMRDLEQEAAPAATEGETPAAGETPKE